LDPEGDAGRARAELEADERRKRQAARNWWAARAMPRVGPPSKKTKHTIAYCRGYYL